MKQEEDYALLLPCLLSVLTSEMAVKWSEMVVKTAFMIRIALLQSSPTWDWCEMCFPQEEPQSYKKVNVLGYCWPICSHHHIMEFTLYESLSHRVFCIALQSSVTSEYKDEKNQ